MRNDDLFEAFNTQGSRPVFLLLFLRATIAAVWIVSERCYSGRLREEKALTAEQKPPGIGILLLWLICFVIW